VLAGDWRLPEAGEATVIRDRKLPVAKLVLFIGEDASGQDLLLVAAGKMRMPQIRLDGKKLSKIPTGSVKGNKAIQAAVSDREEDQGKNGGVLGCQRACAGTSSSK
jgi:hypothetical protein